MPKRLTVDRLLSKLGIASRDEPGVDQCRASPHQCQRVVRDPATWVIWPKDSVSLDDQPIQDSVKRFFLFHKPKGVITTHSDEQGRKTIFDAAGGLGLYACRWETRSGDQWPSPAHQRFGPVELSHRSGNKVMRTYLVTVRGAFTETHASEAVVGVVDAGECLQCHTVKIQKSSGRESHLEVVLIQGKTVKSEDCTRPWGMK